MKIQDIPAKQCEFFKQLMLENKWRITHQDAGQTHLVGWGYEIHWLLDNQKAILRYSDKQGVASAILEYSDAATDEMNGLLNQLKKGEDD